MESLHIKSLVETRDGRLSSKRFFLKKTGFVKINRKEKFFTKNLYKDGGRKDFAKKKRSKEKIL